jgi:hypothetical protein
MSHKKRKTLSATAMAVYLSLNVEVIDDRRGASFIALPLLSLTWALMAGWQAQTRVIDLHHNWHCKLNNWLAQLELMQTMIGIGWRSATWSLGF